MSQTTPFHRLFGYSWLDFFDGTDIVVETELDLSLKQQFVDITVVRKGQSPIPRPLPDGFDFPVAYTLITFKSYQQPLDARALHELIGHYINLCKRFSPSLKDLLPPSDFRLIAVTVRSPIKLAKEVDMTAIGPGVYDVFGFGLAIRVIVVNELPKEQQNAMLHLFSPDEELLRYARANYKPHSSGTSTLLYQLLREYCEDQNMSEKLKEFYRQSIDELLQSLPAEALRNALPVEERLKGLPVEERLKGLPAEALRNALPVEERLKGLSADEMIRAIPPDVLEALTRRLKGNGTPKAE